MRNLSMLTPIASAYCLLLIFLLYHITVASSISPAYIAVDNIKLNCGSGSDSGRSNNSKGSDGRDWSTGDIHSKFFPPEEHNLKSNTSEPQVEGFVQKAPYTTARISYSQFTYVFPVTLGPKFVRLFFHPASYYGFERSTDFFTVKAGSFTLLRNFNASNYIADSLDEKTLVKEFCINFEENEKLNLSFIPLSTSSGNFYAFINGIEIVSMPKDLYYRPEGQSNESDEKVPHNVSGGLPSYINYNRGLEMVFRLNVGGSLVSSMEDTGLFREWYPDEKNFKGGGEILNSSLIPIFSKIPKYTAPIDVYRSARSMGLDVIKNLRSNLTWGLRVDSGFNYLVRLHFCEIDSKINTIDDRRFMIYINCQLAQEVVDILLWTDYRDTPFYKDYIVTIQNKGVLDENNKHILSIDLHPRLDTSFYDAILNGVEVFKLSNPDGNLAGAEPKMMPYPSPSTANAGAEPKMMPYPSPSTANESKAKRTILIAIGSGMGFIVVLTSVCCMVLWKLRKTKCYGSYYPLSKCWCWWYPYKRKSTRTKASSLPEELCRHFSLDELKIATNNFYDELIIGRGGFGNVYKGVVGKGLIDDGTMTVAIKRLDPESRQGAKEFKTEIKMLSQLRHVNLVSLIGYCNNEGAMILVYDYMTNGTLGDHLYDTNDNHLTWKQRLQICIGAARGLHYLHTCNKNPIIHRDVKTSNILLDDNWVSKVSDFGLSKMGLHHTAVSTLVKGTWGYLDPDYARRQQVTEKSDVYSFGVVMLEVLCARKAVNPKLEQEQWHLGNWARKCIEKGTVNQIIDPYLKGKIAPKCFMVYVEVAESCVRDQGIQRPMMNDVMEKLEFALELQETSDAAQEKINPNGEITYQDMLSFRVAGCTTGVGSSLHNDCGPLLDPNSGLTNPSLDSNNVTRTSQDIFTNKSNI